MKRICVIPADGIGQEVIPAAVEVLEALNLGLEFVWAEAGWECFQRCGNALPDTTIAAVASADATLFGATSSPSTKVEGYKSPILGLRRYFDLYANLRPVASLPGPFSRQGVDLLVVRENTEGLYAGRERREGDTAIAERVITVRGSERIAHIAFELAVSRQPSVVSRQPQVTIVHKANVLKETDGLFREVCLRVAAGYPQVAVEEMLVDACAMRLVKDPERFDVIVTTNLFGDILSDEAAALMGGLGVAPSGNIGVGAAVFEPVHGSAPDIAGKGIANPVGAILSAALMLEHLGARTAATRVQQAVVAALKAGLTTPDLGGRATMAEVIRAIRHHL
ncbi:MAG: isocitrate dehydrogenase [Chloroflexi bacterium RBG_16_57_9]|nr:MAG: isocitrate dehydrogenase [Chloroflexi bacterium RBG_16_57_9]